MIPTLRIMFTSLSTRVKKVLGSSSGYIVTFSNYWTSRVFSASDIGIVHSGTTPQASRTELQAASFSSVSVLHVASKRHCHTFQSSCTVYTPCILSEKKRLLQLITSTEPIERYGREDMCQTFRTLEKLESPNPAQGFCWVICHFWGRTSAVV